MERGRKQWPAATQNLKLERFVESGPEDLGPKHISIKRVATYTPRRSARSRDWYMESQRNTKHLKQFDSKEMREILSMENSDNWAGRFDLSDRNSVSNKEELDTIKTQMA